MASSSKQAAPKQVACGIVLRIGALAALAVLVGIDSSASGQGVAFRGVSPVNQSMAGASTACPIDSAGAIHWNPATISGLPSSDISFGMELILPSAELSSRINAGALGGGFPPVTLAGSERSESGAIPVPSMAFVHKEQDSPWSYGLGLFGIGGSSVNFPASLTDPILTPQPPNGLGLGRLSANVDILQLAPTVSYELTQRLAVGLAPTVTIARLYASPLFLAARDDVNSDGFPTFPTGVGTRYHWGGGFQVGLYYTTDCGWHFGTSVKSPQWMEPFRFRSEDELGRPQTVHFHLNYPLIVSVGASYAGFENWIFACDVRYFDYANTTGFGSSGFGPDGALTGLAWNNIMSVAFGAQRQITDRLSVRGGYSFNENPIDSDAEQFNVASPLIVKHSLHAGLSYVFADNWIAAVTYSHSFENEVTGPLSSALGPIPGTSVTSTASADTIYIGFSKRF